MPLIADATTGEIAGWVAGTTAVLTTLGAGGKWFLNWLGTRRDRALTAGQKQRKDAMDELYEILAVQRKDREDDRAVIHDLRNELNTVKLELAVNRHELDECKRDRTELHELYEDMARAMAEANLPVPFRLTQRHRIPEGDK